VDWPRLWLTLAMVALCVVFAGLLLLGWRNRARRQSEFGAPPAEPADPGADLAAPLTGVYVSTTKSGQWQNRIVVHSVGRRAAATVELHAAGVLIDRIAETPLWIPRSALVAVGTAPGVAGKVMALPDGILVLTWRWDGVTVDSGFRADDPDAQADWIHAATALLSPQSGATA
jgi:hypothetical protein